MVAKRLEELRERVKRAAQRAGREASAIRILAVTKTHPVEAVEEAIAAGHGLFGENRVQEAAAKYEGIGQSVELHLIGHLQRNKAALVPGLFSWVESIDRLATARALSDRCAQAGWECSVLLQFNSSGEPTKSGYTDADLLVDEAATIAELPALRLRGVMTIGPFVDEPDPIERAFERTRALFERLRRELPGDRIDTLSMGMSNDYELAIVHGSTEIRVGSLIFGSRS